MKSIKQIARETNIPEQTLRRYVDRFANLIDYRVYDRGKKFPQETVELFKTIYSLYQEGKKTEEIYEIISQRGVPVVVNNPPAVQQNTIELLTEVFSRSAYLEEQILQELKAIREALTARQERKTFFQRLRDRLKGGEGPG